MIGYPTMYWFPFTSIGTRTIPIGLHLSDHALTLLEANKKREIVRFNRLPLEHGILENGRVREPQKLSTAVKQLFETARNRPVDLSDEQPVIMAIPESQTFTHLFTIPPGISRDNIDETVRSKAARLIPADLATLYFDWHIVEQNPGVMTRVLFAAAPREIVDAYIAAAEANNLLPVAIDMETASLARTLLPPLHPPTVIIDIGARTTNLGFFDEVGRLGLSVTVPIGGNTFTDALVSRLHISWDEAEELKKREGMDRRIPENRAMVIIQEGLQQILHEVHTATTYYESTYGKQIERVILAGGSSQMPDIVPYFSMNMRHDVSLGNPVAAFKKSPLLEEIAHPILLAPAAGLALRGLLKAPDRDGINLLHGWEGERWGARQSKILAVWRRLAVPIFIASMALLGYVIYAYLYVPLRVFEEESASRTPPLPGMMTEMDQQGVPSVDNAPESLPAVTGTETPQEKTGVAIDEEESSPDMVTHPVPRETFVVVTETPTGWLRIRSGPGTAFSEIGKVYPGEQYPLLGEDGEWVYIRTPDHGEGWISASYTTRVHMKNEP